MKKLKKPVIKKLIAIEKHSMESKGVAWAD